MVYNRFATATGIGSSTKVRKALSEVILKTFHDYFSIYRALSVRTVASIWLFFTLIMVSSYTANLAAFLTIETPQVLIENVKDLSENKGGVVYGAKRTGSTKTFFAVTYND